MHGSVRLILVQASPNLWYVPCQPAPFVVLLIDTHSNANVTWLVHLRDVVTMQLRTKRGKQAKPTKENKKRVQIDREQALMECQ